MNAEAMRPHGLALLAWERGETDASLVIRREDGFEERLPVRHFFRSCAEFSPIEAAAVERCRGHVLDIGAGTGLHALELQSRGHAVTAIDVSPEAVAIMRRRGVREVREADVLDFGGGPFDTLLMLGHGIGLVEDLPGVRRFLDVARGLIADDGQLLLHSLDVGCTDHAGHLAYHDANRRAGRYPGSIGLRFEYDGEAGASCRWLHVDPRTLEDHAAGAGWSCEIIRDEAGGDYLARLSVRRGGEA